MGFSFDLKQALHFYVSISTPEAIALIQVFIDHLKNDTFVNKHKKELLKVLLRSIIDPKLTLFVARSFRPLLPYFISELSTSSDFAANYLEVCSAFSKILPVCPQCMGFAVRYFQTCPSIFTNIHEKDFTSQEKTFQLLEIVKTAFRFLKHFPTYFVTLWNWRPIFSLTDHPDSKIKWYATQCASIYLGVSDSTKTTLLHKIPENLFLSSQETEQEALENLLLFFNNEDRAIESTSKSLESAPFIFMSEDLNSNIVDVCGILLPRKPTSIRKNSTFVYTKTSEKNMITLALAVSQRKPILLEGVTGSGKTAQISELADLTGNHDIIKVHLGDQADAKILLGTYICTEIPGEFLWQPGALAQAVKDGRWIVIEDIDLAPVDVLSVLVPLLETKQLFIPGRGEIIKAADGFQLFATQTLGVGGSKRSHTSILNNLWTRVIVEPISKDELTTVIQNQFLELSSFAQNFLHTFSLLMKSKPKNSTEEIPKDENMNTGDSNEPQDVALASGRFLSTRDLLKWVKRVHILYQNSIGDANTRENIFYEAVDCFCGMIPKPDLRKNLIQAIGSSWNISPEKVHQYITLHKPTIQRTISTFSVGRVTIPRDTLEVDKNSLLKSKSNFAFTRHSLMLMEKIGVSIQMNEPVLLVGETGTGKTTVIQYIADQLGQNLVVLNLNQQSEAVDLLGGFKPVDLRTLCTPLKNRFEKLFPKAFSIKKNGTFLETVISHFVNGDWKSFLLGLRQAVALVESRPDDKEKSKNAISPKLRKKWRELGNVVSKFQMQEDRVKNNFAFSFVEGSLVKAVKDGHWVLLDEINLASAETLESLSGLLEGGSITLNERGDVEEIKRHPNFRIFACMNPPTDVGKKELPPGLRNRFTEFYVEELGDPEDLRIVVRAYLQNIAPNSTVADDIVNFYLEAKNESNTNLSDGSNHKPHYSLRTLCRALEYIQITAKDYGFPRAVYEGFSMSFLTQLNGTSILVMENLIKKHLIKGQSLKSIVNLPKKPQFNAEAFESFWLPLGDQEPKHQEHYILTDSIKKHLNNLARIVIAKKYPVLLQGPTSSGKTSMIEYLAKRTGHRFVRINNHDHTDLQEYLGTYISNSEGKLVFQEGILVEAVRKGYWIVLDELNLAPSEVLEALNRLLDDNRELFIPETQQIVKPHPDFLLFATQNPPGLYGGRKVLSKAFRNRFLELHFDDIPENELETILEKRCKLPKSFSQKLVSIMRDLQRHRQSTQLFAGKHGFITLRDLFRWAERRPGTYDELAQTGYMLLAERLRRSEEKVIVKQVLEKYLKVTISVDKIYDCTSTKEFEEVNRMIIESNQFKIVWTPSMKRLFTLVSECLKFKEPVLLVGETGTGKTTICQLLSILLKRKLHVLNCHQNTETADFLGGLRPVRAKNTIHSELTTKLTLFLSKNSIIEVAKNHNIVIDLSDGDIEKILSECDQLWNFCQTELSKRQFKDLSDLYNEIKGLQKRLRSLFEWHDGPLVQAMKNGDLILVDEISLADDAILERLNSVLEPHRLLVLAEKGSEEIEELYGHEDFRILATMNPGGDFGKKELSPAMRNRFTEIWVPSITDNSELELIIEKRFTNKELIGFSKLITQFSNWFFERQKTKQLLSLRDILTWADFMNYAVSKLNMNNYQSFYHGASMVLLDGLGVGQANASATLKALKDECTIKLIELIPSGSSDIYSNIQIQFKDSPSHFGVSPFLIEKGNLISTHLMSYALNAPTTGSNVLRVLRGMQLSKPILLEGSAGVGKTSLITALANATKHNLVRINLSEQTDLMDLLGSDLPVNGGKPGEFTWCDGVLLRAIRNGDWVLLDELNLASQSVLEGLNSILDHRSTVYIPELDRSFECPRGFRVFACQNPTQQGGGRKGLPKSFLNRFTKVYLDNLDNSDLFFIASNMYPAIDQQLLSKMIQFNSRIHRETMIENKFGRKGAPWEFNLRDVFRWCELLLKYPNSTPGEFIDLLYLQRMRSSEDRICISTIYSHVFGEDLRVDSNPSYFITPTSIQIGRSFLQRQTKAYSHPPIKHNIQLLHRYLNVLESVMTCVDMNWMTILTGTSSSGKTSIVRLLSHLTRNTLHEFSMNTAVDTTELLGGFEQLDLTRYKKIILEEIQVLVNRLSEDLLTRENGGKALREIHDIWSMFIVRFKFSQNSNTSTQTTLFAAEESNMLLGVLGLIEKLWGDDFKYSDIGLKHPKDISKRIKELQTINPHSITGRFEWIDGMLIKALEEGHWILMDNVNFCNPSVLDRLNPLLENNGYLLVNERGTIDGQVKIIRPHPNFRIFLTMDPKNGEISRPMRNRGIEICILENPLTSDDTTIMLGSMGIPAPIAEQMIGFQEMITRQFGSSIENPITLRNILEWGNLLMEQLRRGISLKSAMNQCIEQLFIRTRAAKQQDSLRQVLSTLPIGNISMFKYEIVQPTLWPIYVHNYNDSVYNTIDRDGSLLLNYSLLVHRSHLLKRSDLKKNLQLKDAVSLPPPNLAEIFQGYQIDYEFKKYFIGSESQLHNLKERLIYAARYFLETISLGDFRSRMEWLKQRKFSENDIEDSMNVVLEKIQEEVKEISKNIPQLNSLAYLPFNSNLYSEFFTRSFGKTFATEDYLNLLAKYFLYIEYEFALQLEKKNFKEIANPEDLTIINQSYLQYNRKMKSKQINSLHSFIYPFFLAFDEWIIKSLKDKSAKINLNVAKQLIKLRNQIFQSLNKIDKIFTIEEFVVNWQWIVKQMKKIVSGNLFPYPTENLVNIVDKIAGWVREKGYISSKSQLWVFGGHTQTFMHESLFTVDHKIRSILYELTHGDHVNQWNSKFQMISISKSTKSEILDALFIIRRLNSHFDESNQALLAETQKLLEALNKIPIPAKKENIKEEDSEDSAKEFKNRLKHREYGTTVIFDFNSVAEELSILSILWTLLNPDYLDTKTGNVKENSKELLKKIAPRINKFIEDGLENTSRDVSDFVPYKYLIWSLNEEGSRVSLSSLIQEMTTSFRNRLWNGTFSDFSVMYNNAPTQVDMINSGGSARLYQGTQTAFTYYLLTKWENLSISDYGSKVLQLKQLSSILFRTSIRKAAENDWIISFNSFSHTLYCFWKTFKVEEMLRIHSLMSIIRESLETGKKLNPEIIQEIIEVLKKSSDAQFLDLITPIIVPCLTIFFEKSNTSSKDYRQSLLLFGQVTCLTGLLRLLLVLPTQPMDYTSKYLFRLQSIRENLNQFSTEIQVRKQLERLYTGKEQNRKIDEISQQVSELVKSESSLVKKVPFRPVPPQFSDLYSEVTHFSTTISSKEKILSMMRELVQSEYLINSEENSSSIFTQELMWQDKSGFFIANISKKFPHYQDITSLIISSILQVKHGLRIIVVSKPLDAQSSQRGVLESISRQLNLFPNFEDKLDLIRRLLSATTLEIASTYLDRNVVHTILWTAFYKLYLDTLNVGHISEERLSVLERLFEVFVETSSRIEEERKLKEEEKQKLFKYRTKDHTAVTSEQKDESDLRELFPDFEEAFSDLQLDDGNVEQTSSEISNEVMDATQILKASFHESDLYRLYRLHKLIFEKYRTQIVDTDSAQADLRDRLESIRLSFELSNMINRSFNYQINRLDEITVGSNLVMTNRILDQLQYGDGSLDNKQSGALSSGLVQNIYKDPMIEEAKLILGPLQKFIERVNDLLVQFPDHPILLQLRKLASRILSFPISTPLMKLLTGLELLLTKSQQWEEYASKRVSIKVLTQIGDLDIITSLIVRFRKLELQSWPKILDVKAQNFLVKAVKWWPRLYKLLCVEASSKEEDQHNYFEALFTQMEQFIINSSWGEFLNRLEMIHTFYNHISSKSEISKGTQATLANMLFNMEQYFRQFLPIFEKRFVDLRQPVEKELKEFITLTKWDDSKTNYYRLKENSEKSHRTLVRISKKYEEILDQPASEIFNAPTDDNEKQIEQSEESPNFTTSPKDYLITLGANLPSITTEDDSEIKNLFALDDTNSAHNRLDILSRVMRKICEKDILKNQSISLLKTGIENVEETSTSIIQRMAHLRDHETEKSVKKFALTELLKGLAELGLSSRQSSSSLEQKDSYHLFTSSPLDIERLIGKNHVIAAPYLALWNKVNDYHYKNILRLIRLRQYAKSFSKDISKREVEKSIGFVEHLFFVISQQRENLLHYVKEYRSMERYTSLFESINRAQNSNSNSILFPPQELSKQFVLDQKSFFDQLSDLMNEYSILCRSIPPHDHKGKIQELLQKSEQQVNSCKTKINSYIARYPFFTEQFVTYDSIELVRDTFSQFSHVRVWLRQLSEYLPGSLNEPLNRCISKSNDLESKFLQETSNWDNKDNINRNTDLAKKFVQDINSVISHIQISIQKLRDTQNSKLINEVDQYEENGMPTNYMIEIHRYFQSMNKSLDMKSLNEKLGDLIQDATVLVNERNMLEICAVLLNKLKPLVEQYQLLIQWNIYELLKFNKSSSKLEYILLNVFSALFQKGFCAPQEQEEDTKFHDNVEGTGIGEGQGNKDISDQIEDEDQALGHKEKEEEQTQKNEKEKLEEDEGVDMKENDFEGTMENVDKKEQEDSEEEEPEEQELPKEMGELEDENKETVDEQLWNGDEDEDEGEENQEKLEKDSNVQPNEQESEMQARQSEEKEDKKKQKPPEKKEKETPSKEEAEEEAQEGEDEPEEFPEQNINDMEENVEENQFVKPHEEPEEFKIEEGMFDDEGQKEEEKEEEEEEQPMDIDQMDLHDEDEDKDEIPPDPEDEKNREDIPEEQNPLDSNEDGDKEIEQVLPEDNPDEPIENPEDFNNPNQLPDPNKTEAFGVKDNVGIPSNAQMDDKEEEEKESANADDNLGKVSTAAEAEGEYMESTSENQQDDNQRNERLESKPQRALGDVLKEWKKRLNMVENVQKKEKKKNEAVEEEFSKEIKAGAVLEDQDEKEDAQALGPTDQPQDNVPMIDEDEEEISDENNQEKEKKEKEEETEEEKNQNQEIFPNKNNNNKSLLKKEKDSKDQDMEDAEDDLKEDEMEEEQTPLEKQENLLVTKHNPVERTDIQKLDIEQLMKLKEDLDNQPALEVDMTVAMELWKKFHYATSELSQDLCEQLRLILEPTLATKLKGDYRTGKRINMKKVIPYIASDFKKDKIWLRRTQPSKRQYQIMLCIDDSRSMIDKHAGQMACEAMTMIAKALSQLEVGELGIASFGENVKILHKFNEPFSDEAGAKVLTQFKFQQKSTDVMNLMQMMVKILEYAKNQTIESHQLVFLISDGRLDDKVGLKQALRECSGKNIFVVFIVIEDPKNKHSILELQSVNFPSGKLELTRYIDNFPFSYYVILRNIQNLPEVLADALRQWFELIKPT